MTGISRRDRLRFRISRLYHQARAHLPELGLSGLVTAGEALVILQEQLREHALNAIMAALPHPLLALPLAFVAPALAGLAVHAVRRRRKPAPQPLFGHLPFPDRVEPLIGRQAKLREIADRARESGIVVVQGATGTGTSTLAVHGAWELAAEARKQRYADVRGPDRHHPETSLSVAQRVLRTLDRPPGSIQEPGDAAPLVIEALTGTGRVLLLDNVSTWSQVAWLPPRVPGAHIMVAGELAGDPPQHIQPIQLGPLSSEAGQELLAAHIQDQRTSQAPQSLRPLADACLGSPAEIVRIGRWLAQNPRVALEGVVDDLSRLSVDEKLGFVLQLSVEQLGPTAKQLFILLAGLPIAEVDHQAAAALAGLPSAGEAIGELAERGLVENVRMTRVRVTGAFQDAGTGDTAQDAAAWRRLVEYFADQADAFAARLRDDEAARDWLAAEDRVLLQVLAREPAVRRTSRALGRIADAVEDWFTYEQRHEDRLRAAALLARAAESLGDETVQATAELRQSAILLTLGDPAEARRHFNRAAALRVRVESWPAELHLGHAAILLAGGDEFSAVESALIRYGQALSSGDLAGHSLRFMNVAALLMRRAQLLGHEDAQRLYADARAQLFEALDRAHRGGDEHAQAHAHELLAQAHWHLDRPFDADRHWTEAERMYGHRHDEIGRARCHVHQAIAMMAESDARQDEAAKLLETAGPRLPPTGLTTALAYLHLARLRPERATAHRASGLAALAPWDGIAEPKQVTEIRSRLAAPES
ncbi:hypothetical protein [Nonomuraea sp. LPB2021202275-12-8]|uniref:hypothetical protein n=1 Tax=Nonomuraea sp. LPB2021202275-12-8 TaxID=3120159 RepID=UPI00300D8433